jgi:SAM-dependent methyltransferase
MEKRLIYHNGHIYDIQNANDREDMDFYSAIVKRYGDPVLELACGTGVISIPIAKDGYDVTGLDLSNGMLEQARKKAEGMSNILFLNGNMSDFSIGKKFKTIFAGFNSVCHLHGYDEIKGMINSVKNHLEDDGAFVFDCFIPDFKILSRDKNKCYPVFEGNELKITETNEYDPIEQINHIKWYHEYKNEIWIEDLDMRMFYPQETQNYLSSNGMVIIEKYGNHRFGEFGRQNRFQIYICKKS